MMNYTGEIAILISTVIWAHCLIFYKKYAQEVPPYFLNLFKNSVASLALLVVVIWGQRFPPTLYESNVPWMLLSGVFGLAIGDYLLFMALQRIGASLSTIIMLFAPTITAVCGILLLSEYLSWIQWLGIFVTTVAIMFVVYSRKAKSASSSPEFRAGITYAVISAVFQAFGMLAARYAAQDMDMIFGAGLRLWGASAVLLVGLVFVPKQQYIQFRLMVKGKLLFGLTMVAVFGTALTMVLFICSAQFTKAAITSTLGSTVPLWILPGSYYFLGERINKRSVFYTLVAFFGVSLLFV